MPALLFVFTENFVVATRTVFGLKQYLCHAAIVDGEYDITLPVYMTLLVGVNRMRVCVCSGGG